MCWSNATTAGLSAPTLGTASSAPSPATTFDASTRPGELSCAVTLNVSRVHFNLIKKFRYFLNVYVLVD